jgi:hypothetical protein
MNSFIDTANLDAIREATACGLLDGVTRTVLVASDVVRAGLLAADVVAVPASVLRQRAEHPLTELGLERLLAGKS